MTSRARWRVSLLAVVGAVVMAGCLAAEDGFGGGGSSGGSEPTISGPVPVVTDLDDIELPSDAYELSDTELDAISLAEDLLAQDCMARFDIDWAAPRRPSDTASSSPRHAHRYGESDVSHASQWGYRGGPLSEDEGMRGRRAESELSEAEAKVLGGAGGVDLSLETPAFVPDEDSSGMFDGQEIPEGGCHGEAARILADDVADPFAHTFSERLFAETFILAEGDSRVQAAFDDWSACMADRGYDYDEPTEPSSPRTWPDDLTDKEINTAIADVECKYEVNLFGIWSTVEIAYQEREIEENAERLAEVEALQQERVKNAAEVVGAR